MFSLMRTIHLCTALFSLASLLMYGISAVQMAHYTWFDLRPAVTNQQFTLTPGLTDARIAASELIRNGLRGELRSIRQTQGGFQLSIVRPGTVYDATYTVSTGATTVKTSIARSLGMLNRLHHSEGLWHDSWLLNAWTILAAVISLALFIMGATGLYLWFQNHRERLIGGVLLAAALALTLPLIISMRW